jgi:signal transduction histidine kinase
VLIKNSTVINEYFQIQKTSVKNITNQSLKMLTMQKYSQRMQENLINDLMDLAKLENNKFKIEKDFFSLPQMVKNSFQILMGSAAQNNIELVAEIDKESNLAFVQCLLSDERRLQQTLLNLMSNSMKFTNPNGQIKVLVKILSKQQEKSNEDFSILAKKVK